MFATHSLKDARPQLDHAISGRLFEHPILEPAERVRFPVGLFFIRGDRAGTGRDLAEQIVASFGFWNDDSSKYFDMVFPGWGTEDKEKILFDRTAFRTVRDEIQTISKWKSSGETDILFLNYDYSTARQKGDFAFDEAMCLPVEVMIADGRIRSIDA